MAATFALNLSSGLNDAESGGSAHCAAGVAITGGGIVAAFVFCRGAESGINGGIVDEFGGGILDEFGGAILEALGGGILIEIGGGILDEVEGRIVVVIDGGILDEDEGRIVDEIDGGILDDLGSVDEAAKVLPATLEIGTDRVSSFAETASTADES